MTQRRKLKQLLALTFSATCLAAPLADAQAPDATPKPDPTSIWTIQDENATISSSKITDRYYVNGLRIGWTSLIESGESARGVGKTVSRNGVFRGPGCVFRSLRILQAVFLPDLLVGYDGGSSRALFPIANRVRKDRSVGDAGGKQQKQLSIHGAIN